MGLSLTRYRTLGKYFESGGCVYNFIGVDSLVALLFSYIHCLDFGVLDIYIYSVIYVSVLPFIIDLLSYIYILFLFICLLFLLLILMLSA